MVTQNLRGFAKHYGRTSEWFDGFRRLNDRRPMDVILVQETRATTHWVDELRDRYARAWGFRPDQLTAPLSYWSTTPTPAAGVAILLHPQSRLQKVKPWHEDRWSEWFMAVQGELDGQLATIVCVYGSTDYATRERTFRDLSTLPPPPGTMYVGGDFNCILDPEPDRSRPAPSKHQSPALQTLLEKWRLADAATEDMLSSETAEAVDSFRQRHHTYRYALANAQFASSRLDRWYVSSAGYSQVMSVMVTEPVSRSDHDSVVLKLRTSIPRPTRAHCQRSLRYPLLECAADAIHERGRQLRGTAGTALAALTPDQSAHEWDALKERIRQESLVIQRGKRSAATLRHRTRMKRLHGALERAKKAVGADLASKPANLDVITDGVDTMALDPLTRIDTIRDELIAVKSLGSLARRRRRQEAYAGPAHMTSKAFFKRISTQYKTQGQGSLPVDPGTATTDADRLANDWRPITQRAPCDPTLQDEFFAKLPPPKAPPDFSALNAPFTVTEVEAAIAQCPKGKASGPDGIPNDWYRELAEPVAEALTPLFTQWYSAGVLPPSFYGATIYCLAKTKQPRTGLDFRPIALLNSDYKIYARVLLNRVRSYVGGLVSPTPFGFVPGRQVHDAVDVWTAVQTLVATGDLPPTLLAVMLDFAKAYDTLDRRFLHLALERHGFPPQLIQAIDTMHLATTAAYLADGQLSRSQRVTTGIRQGCPLAPTLFILAVHILYEMVNHCPHLKGVNLTPSVTIKLVGCADDTTSYLRSQKETAVLRSILDEFAKVSGLKVNLSKSKTISASKTGPADPEEAGDFPRAQCDELFRYLGVLIASNRDQTTVWKTTLQQLTARLHLASIKTTNVLQRVRIARAVIIPKLLFVARHYWPHRDQVHTLQRYVHNYVWFGTTSPDVQHKRAWMSAATSHQPLEEGGLAVPCVLTELMLLSVRTTTHWLQAATPERHAVGAILLGALPTESGSHLAPGRSEASHFRLGQTLTSTGTSIIRRVLARPHEADELRLTRSLRTRAGLGASSEFTWETSGWLTRDYTAHEEELSALDRHQEAQYGRLNVQALLSTPIVGAQLLALASGKYLSASDLPGLSVSDASVGDVVELGWIPGSKVRFRYRSAPYPLSPTVARSFRTLCDLLVAIYPAILRHHQPDDELSVSPTSSTIWRVRLCNGTPHLVRDPGPAEADLGAAPDLPTAQTLARRSTSHTVLEFSPHPLLSPILPLWGDTRPLRTRKLRPLLLTTARDLAKKDCTRRQARAREHHPAIASALEKITWKEIHRLPHSSSRQRLLLHQIKGLRLSGYDRLQQRRGCPHYPAAGSDGGRQNHILWTCPQAAYSGPTLDEVAASGCLPQGGHS